MLIQAIGGQSFNHYLNAASFLTLDYIRHLWQLKTAIFLHRCLMLAMLLSKSQFPQHFMRVFVEK